MEVLFEFKLIKMVRTGSALIVEGTVAWKLSVNKWFRHHILTDANSRFLLHVRAELQYRFWTLIKKREIACVREKCF